MYEAGRSRIRGMFLGLAIGDALFAPNETLSVEEIEKRGRITKYIRPDGHKWFNGRDAGTWTDDTQLTLVLAESLIAKGKIDLDDMAVRHVESYQKEGNLGFGATTKNAIENLSKGVHWSKSGRSDNPKHGTGNGVAMKVAPLGAFRSSLFWSELWVERRSEFMNDLIRLTFMTHFNKMAVESALAQVFAVNYCLGLEKPEDFSTKDFMSRVVQMSNFANYNDPHNPPSSGDNLPSRLGMLRDLDPDSLTDARIIELFDGGTCYVYNSLPFSLAFFIRNPKSIETLYAVGNAGGDTDSNASMVGALIGALNGEDIFPKHLVTGLWQKNRILDVAERFYNKFWTV